VLPNNAPDDNTYRLEYPSAQDDGGLGFAGYMHPRSRIAALLFLGLLFNLVFNPAGEVLQVDLP
jgi:hypothetical protein